jgi:ribosomal protein S18 acetylase RimI-like enzyme
MKGAFTSTDRRLLDYEWIRSALKGSHWGTWLNDTQINEALANSLCLGCYLYRPTPIQIGLLRVVTDKAIFSSITDVIVDEKYRGNGYGRMLMDAALIHPFVRDTIIILHAREDVQKFYTRFGFQFAHDGIMKRDPTP